MHRRCCAKMGNFFDHFLRLRGGNKAKCASVYRRDGSVTMEKGAQQGWRTPIRRFMFAVRRGELWIPAGTFLGNKRLN